MPGTLGQPPSSWTSSAWSARLRLGLSIVGMLSASVHGARTLGSSRGRWTCLSRSRTLLLKTSRLRYVLSPILLRSPLPWHQGLRICHFRLRPPAVVMGGANGGAGLAHPWTPHHQVPALGLPRLLAPHVPPCTPDWAHAGMRRRLPLRWPMAVRMLCAADTRRGHSLPRADMLSRRRLPVRRRRGRPKRAEHHPKRPRLLWVGLRPLLLGL